MIEAVDNIIKEILEHKQPLSRNNILKTETTIIYEFWKQDDLVFTKANKGAATTILDFKNYIEQANKELNNKNY